MVKVVLSLPTWITLLRVALIPVFVLLLIDPSEWMLNVAVYIFIFAAITDYLDGLIARAFGYVSDFGKLLDPLADKVLVLSALIMLTGLKNDQYGEPWVPAWMVVMVVAREIWVTGLRGVAASGGTVVAANSAGKVKSLLQMVSIVCLLLHDKPLVLGPVMVSYQLIGLNLLFLSLVFSYWGAVQYTKMIFMPEDVEFTPTADPSKVIDITQSAQND